jgi:hypothetical protein
MLLFLMRDHKALFLKVVRIFLGNNQAARRHLLEALGGLCEPGGGRLSESRRDDQEPTQVDLERLISKAATLAALRSPVWPLDQRAARKAYLVLFRQIEGADLGKLIVGRKGHPTRFKFRWDGRAESGPIAFRSVLRELDIKMPEWIREKEADVLAELPTQRPPPSAPPNGLRRDDAIARLQSKVDQIHQFGVASLSLFGSVARDEARPDSDVDLLAAFESPVTSDAFFGAKFFLEDLLGKRIDLVTEAALRDPILQAIAPELIRVA